jgi:hypothetical protein
LISPQTLAIVNCTGQMAPILSGGNVDCIITNSTISSSGSIFAGNSTQRWQIYDSSITGVQGVINILAITNTILRSSIGFSNATVNIPYWTTFDAIDIGGAAGATLTAALTTAGTLTVAAAQMRGFGMSVTADRLVNSAVVQGSNSTFFVRDWIQTGSFTQGTSTVSLLAGDNIISNVPTLFNAVKYTTGTARITTNLAVTGTLEFQSGANLDGTGNIIGLANPATVGGNLQSGTITGNVLRVDGIADKASGQLNTPRQGRR